MGKIKLDQMEFRAFHGVYEEERKQGNRFTVDLEVDYPFEEDALRDDLGYTLDYQSLYAITKKIMDVPSNLLEHLSMRIAEDVKNAFPQVNSVTVSVAKYNPPIGGECKSASVTVTI